MSSEDRDEVRRRKDEAVRRDDYTVSPTVSDFVVKVCSSRAHKAFLLSIDNSKVLN